MTRPPAQWDGTDLVFRALNHPVRRALMERLGRSPGRTIAELTSSSGITRQSMKQHLDVLEDAGLLAFRWDGREKIHYLNAVPIVEVLRDWLARFDEVAAANLLRLRSDVESSNADTTSATSREADAS